MKVGGEEEGVEGCSKEDMKLAHHRPSIAEQAQLFSWLLGGLTLVMPAQVSMAVLATLADRYSRR